MVTTVISGYQGNVKSIVTTMAAIVISRYQGKRKTTCQNLCNQSEL
jgi:hypothetical protein